MKVAVFGAGGFIGRNLVTYLQAHGEDVLTYSSSSEGVFDRATGVLSDEVSLPKGTASVIYLAQSPFYREMPEKAVHLWAVNVVSAVKAAELARRSGATKFIYASTGSVYSPSFNPFHEDSPVRRDDWYALSKVQAEEGLALYRRDMAITVARIFGVYGPGQNDKLIPNLTKSIRSQTPIKLAPNSLDKMDQGGLKVSLCFVDDVVDIFSRMLRFSGADIINVASREVFSLREIAETIGDRISIPPIFEIASQPRTGNLVADVTRLLDVCRPRFTAFADGLDLTMSV